MPGTWKQIQVCTHCTPFAFAFSDSLNGLLIAKPSSHLYSKSIVFRTSDGGDHWELVDTIADNGSLAILNPEPFYYPKAGHAFFLTTYNWVTSDTGRLWMEVPFYQQRPITEKFYDIRTIFLLSIGQTFRGMNIYVSRDTSNLFSFYSDPIFPQSYYIKDALILDSLNILLSCLDTNDTRTLYFKSTNGGNTWDQFFIADPVAFKTGSTQHFVRGLNQTSIYIVGDQGLQHPNIDFFFSTDNGKTWDVDSIHGAQVYRLANAGGSQLWAFIGKKPPVSFGGYRNNLGQDKKYFADTLGFSPNDGKTWFHDTKTFIGDTMISMQWISSTDGFIMTERDSSAIIYKFREMSSIKEQSNSTVSNLQFSIIPSITSDEMTIIPHELLEGMLSIYDILGRKIMQEPLHVISGEKKKYSLAGFSTGMYLVSVSSRGKVTSVRFVKD